MKCAACQRDIADGSNFCPFCGNVQPPDAGKSPAPVPPAAGGFGTEPPAQPAYSAPIQPSFSAPAPAPLGSDGPASNKGTIALILGIASVFMDFFGCCCLGIPSLLGVGLGIAAFVMARNELEDIQGGFASRGGEGVAKAARVLGLVGAILGVVCFATAVILVIIGQISPPS